MRWSSVVWLYGRRLRARVGSELAAFAGLAVGVALLFSVQVSNASLGHSIDDLTHGFVGNAQLQLVARSSRGLDERLVNVVARDPSVAAAAPVLQVPGNLVGKHGERGVTILAADQRVADLGGTLLRGVGLAAAPGLRAIVLPSSVARAVGADAGSRATLEIAGRSARVPVVATLGAASVGTLSAAPVVLVPLPYGQRLAGMQGRVSRLYVRAEPGRATVVRRLLAALAGDKLDVRAADFDEAVFRQAAQPNDQSSALYSRVTALIGFMFALNAMLLMARSRRRWIAQKQREGIGARTLCRVLMLDALVLGVGASCAGVALGVVLSDRVFPPAPGYLTIGFPIGTARTIDASAVVTALSAGIGAAVVGTFAPLVRRLRDPVGAAGDTQDGNRQLVLRPGWLAGAVAAIAAAVAVWFVTPQAATAGIVLLVVACVLCLPAALLLSLALAERLTRRARSPVWMLATGQLRSNGTRSIAIAAVAAIAVFASGAIEGARRDLQAGLDTVTRSVNAIADVWITPASETNQLGVATFPATVRAEVARLPVVARADVYRGELLTIGSRLMWVFAPARTSAELVPGAQVLDGDAQVANERLRSRGWATVSQAFAAQHALRLGSTYTIPAPRPQQVRIAAITTNLGWPPGAIVTDAQTFAAGWGADDASALQVQLRAGTPPDTGRDQIAHALRSTRWTGFTVETAAEREHHQRESSRDGLVRLQQISRLVLATASLAMAIAIGALILERRRGLAGLNLRGIRRSHLRATLLLETLLLLGTGCATGMVFALGGAQMLDRWLTTLTGFPVVRSSGLEAAVASFVVIVVAALALTALPTERAAGVSPTEAFRQAA